MKYGSVVLLTILVMAVSASAGIIQNFGFAPDGAYMPIDTTAAGDEQLNPNRSQEDFDVTPTGFSWGGYAAPTGFRVEIDRFNRGGVDFEELVFKQNPVNNYAYTIFDSNGGNSPDQSVDLSGPQANIGLKVSDFWTGWYGGGDNGSGLPGLAGEVRATVLRAMIRDGNGDWYVSDLFCPIAIEAPGNFDTYYDGTLFDTTYDLAGQSWYAVDSVVNANLNLLQGGDEVALTYSATAGSPDLTAVTGGGIYVWSARDQSTGQFAVTEIQWNDVPEPTSLSLLGLGALALIKRRK